MAVKKSLNIGRLLPSAKDQIHNGSACIKKIDIIPYSEDYAAFVAAALAPASVLSVNKIDEGDKAFRVIVNDDQLSLAIGKEGQNARLAAKLTGCKIDIKSVKNANEITEAEVDNA